MYLSAFGMEKEVTDVKNHAIENGFIKKEEWQEIVKGLVKG